MIQFIAVYLCIVPAWPIALAVPVTPGTLTFLGNGYNILFGNPEGDLRTGSGDPGLLITRKIFDFSYDDKKMSLDGRYTVPDQVIMSSRESCRPSVTTAVFEGTKSYQDELKHYVKQLGNSGTTLSGYEFSKSEKYVVTSQSTNVRHHVFFDEVTTCNFGRARYVTELAFTDRFPLSRDFVASACALPTTFDLVEYMRFLDTWGTHIVSEMDIGTKTIKRSQTDYKTLVKFARTIAEHYSANGESISLDMASLRGRLRTEPALFDVLVETLTLGDATRAEPLSLELIGIGEVFDIDYWQLMDRYVSEGLCPAGGDENLNSKRANLVRAMEAYPGWHNAQKSLNPVVQTAITWPVGTYSLPMTNGMSGCPNSAFFWQTGRRFQDTQDLFASNDWSDPCHLMGPYARNNVQQNFCSKTDAVVSEGDTPEWDAGEYCIFKKGSCPSGFSEGWIKWDDQDALNGNTQSGVLPDGVYDHNTLIYYCCREDGDPITPILLPTQDPFFLFRKNDVCQAVQAMSLIEEWFKWDGEDNFVDFTRYYGGSHPYVDSRDDDHKIYYCYYY
ncbi:uncharacterized protein LOC119723332 [Patiria miniata]|uniref:MACPF domain-containing protein n=1 Tax=Patiria miniata TaxID=46514 RepID=A0A913ZDI4_PATMI|nr:uncharacterized protein LOC119723332 [Patiria miniata]XP_038049833.1 uncharacterized protein LOC119723332 [Patiria miniata]